MSNKTHEFQFCKACHPDGWQCERRKGHPGKFHAVGITGPKPRLDKKRNPIDAERVWTGTTRWRETSNRVLAVVEGSPVTTLQIVQATGLARRTVREHLHILKDEDMVKARPDGTWV